MSRLEVVAERNVDEEHAPDTRAAQLNVVATQMLMTALKALSQRFVVALSNLFTLLTAASAFYLWMICLPEISVLKIVGLSIYSVFILALNVWGRRK